MTGAGCCWPGPAWRSPAAASGDSGGGSKEEVEKPIAKKVDGDLVYFNWSEYIDPAVIKGFEKRYGVKVRQSYFDSMSAMMSKLRAGIAYDVIFPTAEYAQRLIQGNQLRKIDRDKLKNADLVYPTFAGALVRRRLGAHDALHDVRHRPRLPRRQRARHDAARGATSARPTAAARRSCSMTSRRASAWRTR